MAVNTITTGDLFRVLKKRIRSIKQASIRDMAESGELPGHRNPLAQRGWYELEPGGIEPFLQKYLSRSLGQEGIREVLRELGINFKQLCLVC